MVWPIILSIITLFTLVASLFPLFKHDGWWVRLFDFPRVQALLLVIGCAWAWYFTPLDPDWLRLIVLAVLLVSAFLHGYTIYPYTPLKPKESLPATSEDEQNAVSILVSNCYTPCKQAEELIQIVRASNPDIVLVLEPDHWWAEHLRPLEATHPHTLQRPLENTYGMLFYSKLEIVEYEVKYLVLKDVPSFHLTLALRSGERIRMYCVHPMPPAPQEAGQSTERDAELLKIGKLARDQELPVIVAGDLNDVAWSHTTRLFRRISGLADPRIGRGFFNTFHAQHWYMRFPLDHVFHSPEFRLVSLDRLPGYGSDHFPMYTELVLAPSALAEAQQPQPVDDDEAETERKIKKGKSSGAGKRAEDIRDGGGVNG